MTNSKKKTRKNSNYRRVFRNVSVDQLCRKTLCDFRCADKPNEALGEREDTDKNLYESAVEFCNIAKIITDDEKKNVFDGKNHVKMTSAEISEFTGIPDYQIERNDFSFKIKSSDDFVRVSMIKLILCDLVADVIKEAQDSESDIPEDVFRKYAAYINFCRYVGILSDEQGVSVYTLLRQKVIPNIPMLSSVTGIDMDTIKKLIEK